MKTKKLIKKVQALLNADRRAQLAKSDSLEKVLKKLEVKDATLRERLKDEQDDEQRCKTLRKLKVIEAQRKKGEKLQHELREQQNGQE